MNAKVNAVGFVILAALSVTGCGGANTAASGVSSQQPSVTASATAATSEASSPTADSEPKVDLIWSHVGKFFDEPQVWYVAKVTNRGANPAYVTLDAKALDESGIIVGSNTASPPAVPPHSAFDYFGYIGGGGALNTPLTGTPAKVTVKEGELRPDGWAPLLRTSDARLTRGDTADTYTDAAYAYNLSVVVANQTDQKIGNMVTQQGSPIRRPRTGCWRRHGIIR